MFSIRNPKMEKTVMEVSQPFLSETMDPKTSDYRVKRLKFAIGLCLLLFIIQFVGGWLSSSLALMADAYHMLSDVFGYIISLMSIQLAKSAASKLFPYGKRRLEILGALASIALLWILTLGLVIEAYQRLLNPKDINAKIMLIMAVAGLFINGLLIAIFGHEEITDEPILELETIKIDFEIKGFQDIPLEPLSKTVAGAIENHTKSDINIRAAMLHAIGDLLCSVGVFISAMVLYFHPEQQWIDPLCTLIFAIVAISTTIPVLSDIGKVLMQTTPINFDEVIVNQELLKINAVTGVLGIQCWALTQKDLVASVQIEANLSNLSHMTSLINDVKKIFRNYGVSQVTVEVVPIGSI